MSNFFDFCSNSFLEKEFITYLENDSIKVVSFDIFETLVFRKVSKPTDIFLKVASNEYVKNIFLDDFTFYNYRIQSERKARIKNSKNEDVTLEQIYENLPIENYQKNYIKNIELEEEYKSIFINLQIKRFIDLALEYKKKLIFVSDMYLSSEQLKYLVFSKLNLKSDYEIFISNEYNATKYSGALFNQVVNKLKLDYNNILHIGDNLQSDIIEANKLGINTLFYNVEKYVNDIVELETKYFSKNISSELINLRYLSSLLNPFKTRREKFFFDMGAILFGPVLWNFSHWIIDLAKEKKILQINCLMREGSIFRKCITKLDNNLDVNLIYASRKSTFLPSLDENVINNNDGINFYKYRKFTIKDFYDLFLLTIDNEIIKSNENNYISESNFIEINNNKLIDLLLKDFTDKLFLVNKNIEIQKNLLFRYLEEQNYCKDSILIDFGGTGTINNNLKKILKDEASRINILFFMHNSGYEKMTDSLVYSYLPFDDNKMEVIRRSHELFEILFNGNNASTIGYEKFFDEVVAITDKNYKNCNEDSLFAFDKGIDVFFEIAKQYEVDKNIVSRNNILEMLTRLLEVPTYEEAKYFGELYYDESSGNSETLIKNEYLSIVSEDIKSFYLNFMQNLSYKVGEIAWPQGVITLLNKNYIREIKGFTQRGINSSAIEQIINILKENKEIKSVYIYGVGQFYKELEPFLLNMNIAIEGLIDSRAKISESYVGKLKVNSLENIQLNHNSTVIVSSVVYAIDITNILIDYRKRKKISLNIINNFSGLIKYE